METIKQNSTLVIIAVLCTITLFVLVFLIFTNIVNPNNRVVSVDPQNQTALTTGTRPTIKIKFINSNLKHYKINYSYIELWKDNPYKNMDISMEVSGNTIIIKPKNVVINGEDYKLEVFDTNIQSVIFTARYSSSIPTPTPIKLNNKSLIPFLPKNTTNYSMSYDSTQNVYIVNYYLNFESNTNINDQIEEIKNEVLLFVRSKNIDPNTVKIVWKGT